MRTTRIEIEGKPEHQATIARSCSDRHIEVKVTSPRFPEGHTCRIPADSDEEIQSMAERLHYLLEGCRGTRGDVVEYYRRLMIFAD